MNTIIRYLLTLLILVQVGSLLAQQPAKVAKKFFPDPEMDIQTPWFQKGRKFTTYNEMMTYICQLVTQHPDKATLNFIGKTQKGKEIPAVTISGKTKNTKMRVLFLGRVHGDEPGSTESMLYTMERLLNDPELAYLLQRLEITIIPMVNIDGGSHLERVTANTLDLNRDQSKLATPEAVVLRAFYNNYNPQVVIDFHEFQPPRADYTLISTDNITNSFDAMFLYTGNLNVPEELRNLTAGKFVGNAREALDAKGLRHHDYFTTSKKFGEVVFNVGGINPRSTANAFSLGNSVAILMELRGVKIGKTSLKRRINTAFTLAESYLKTAYDNFDEVMNITAEAARSKNDIVVTSKAKTVDDYVLPFISMNTNEIVELEVNANLSLESTPTLTRKRPEAYYITASHPEIAQKLKQLGVTVETLTAPATVEVEAYTVESHKAEYSLFEKFYPVKVKTSVAAKTVTFPTGSFVIPMNQKNGNVAASVLEPEAPNGFINYRVYETKQGEELPVYRKMNSEK